MNAPKAPTTPVAKTRIPEQVGDSQTAHLIPVVELLKRLGNRPSSVNGFEWDRDGHATYTFDDPIDVQAVREHFELPPDVHIVGGRYIQDGRHRVQVSQRVVDDERADYFAAVTMSAIGPGK